MQEEKATAIVHICKNHNENVLVWKGDYMIHRHIMKTLWKGIALLVVALFVLTGCGSVSQKNANTLTYASSDYVTINPILNSHDELPDLIFSGLMKYDGQGNPVPDLARNYEFDETTQTYTFHLRDGVTWHDGQPFTAKDVAFTLDTLTHSDTLEAAITDNYKDIESVETPDDKTVRIHLRRPNAAMLNYLTIGILPKHLLEGKDLMNDEFNRHPIGTGRYAFDSWDKGQSIVLTCNDAYYGTVPKIERIVFKIIPDENAKAAQVKAGTVDLAWLNAQNAKAFRNDSNFVVYDFKTADYRAIAPNFAAPFWKKHKDLVPLLGYGIDKEAIIKSVLGGQGEVAYSPIQQNGYYNNDAVEKRNYDPQRFKEGVEQLGWKLGDDGIYEKNGEKLSFSVDVREYETERVDMAKIVAAQLKPLGVDMKVHIVPKVDWKTLESFFIGEAAPFDPDNGTADLFATKGSGNYTAYSDEAVDMALAKARMTYDAQQRKVYYDEFQRLWAKDPAYIMLAYLDGNYVATPRLKGLATQRVLGHHATGVFWNVEDWTLEP